MRNRGLDFSFWRVLGVPEVLYKGFIGLNNGSQRAVEAL